MDISLLPPLHLIYAENPSDSGTVNSLVRQRWQYGDELIRSSMTEVASLAVDGRKVLLAKDNKSLAALMNCNIDLRRIMFGDDVLGALNIEMVMVMVKVARGVGPVSKFTGSGGAVVVFCPEIKLLEEACKKAGFVIQPVTSGSCSHSSK